MSTCRTQGSDLRRRVDAAVSSVMPATIDVIIERGWMVLTEAAYRAPTGRGVRALRTLLERRRRATGERTHA